MKNDYIKSVDETAVKKHDYKKDIKNSLKITKKVQGRVDGTQITFDLDSVRKHNGLSQIFVRFYNMTFSPVATVNYPLYFALCVRNVLVRNRAGLTFMFYEYLQTMSRIQEASGTALGSFYDDVTALTPTTTEGFLPIFSWFDEHDPLDLRSTDPVEIIINLNDLSTIGVGVPIITTASYELICTFHDTPNSDTVSLYKNPDVYYLEKSRKLNSYDIYYEPVVSLVAGETIKRIPLTCPYPAYIMNIAIMKTGLFQAKQITNIKLETPNEVILDINPKINFKIGSVDALGVVEESIVNYWFSKDEDRKTCSGLLEFADSFFPTYLTVTFDDPSADAGLHVWFEHKTELEIGSDGHIVRKPIGSFKGPGPLVPTSLTNSVV